MMIELTIESLSDENQIPFPIPSPPPTPNSERWGDIDPYFGLEANEIPERMAYESIGAWQRGARLGLVEPFQLLVLFGILIIAIVVLVRMVRS